MYILELSMSSVQAPCVAGVTWPRVLFLVLLERRLVGSNYLERFPCRGPIGSPSWVWFGALRLGLTQPLPHWSWQVCGEPPPLGHPGQSILLLWQHPDDVPHCRRVSADEIQRWPPGSPQRWRPSSWVASQEKRTLRRRRIEQQQNGGYASYNYSTLRKSIVRLISSIDQEQHTTMQYEF